MYTLLPVALGVAAIILMLLTPHRKLEANDLPALFNDEPDGVVEPRSDLARKHEADECYRICLLRSYITYAIQRRCGETNELFLVTYRGREGPMLEMENDRPLRFGTAKSKEQKVYFSPREQRDIAAFVHTVRSLVSRNRALV